MADKYDFKKHVRNQKFGPVGAPPIPPPLVITITYNDQSQIRIQTDREVNPLELGSLCTQIATKQFEIMTQQAMKMMVRPNRYAIHQFDGDDLKRGCGICGRKVDDLEIHDAQHASDLISDGEATFQNKDPKNAS